MANVFVSYATGDAALVSQLITGLRSYGMEARTAGPPPVTGGRWSAHLADEIADARIVILLITPSSADSAFCRRVWSEALQAKWADEGKSLCAIVVSGVTPPPFLMGTRYWTAATPEDMHEAARQIAEEAPGTTRSADDAPAVWTVAVELPTRSARQLAYSADGELLAASTEDGRIRLWDAGTWRVRPGMTAGAVRAIAFSPGGDLIAGIGDDSVIRLWDTGTGRQAATIGHPDIGGFCTMAFSPDGRAIVTGGIDGTIRIWGTDGTQETSLAGHTESVEALACSPDGGLVASAAADRTVRIWNRRTGKADRLEVPGRRGHVRSVVFSPDGRTVAGGGSGGQVLLWDLTANGRITELNRHHGPVHAVSFSPDAQILASAGDDGRVRIWNVVDGSLAADLPHPGTVTSIGFSPDGLHLAACTNLKVLLWEVPTALRRHRLTSIEAAAYSMGPSRDEAALYLTELAGQLRHPDEEAPDLRALLRLGIASRAQGRLDDADRLLHRAVDTFGDESTGDLETLALLWTNLGLVAQARRDWERSWTCLRTAVDLHGRACGPEHPGMARLLMTLGEAAQRRGDYRGASDAIRRALSIRRRWLGPDHPSVAATLVSLGVISLDQGDFDIAAMDLHMAVDIRRRSLGPDHPTVAEGLLLLAVAARGVSARGRCRAYTFEALEIAKLLRRTSSALFVEDEMIRRATELLAWADGPEAADRWREL